MQVPDYILKEIATCPESLPKFRGLLFPEHYSKIEEIVRNFGVEIVGPTRGKMRMRMRMRMKAILKAKVTDMISTEIHPKKIMMITLRALAVTILMPRILVKTIEIRRIVGDALCDSNTYSLPTDYSCN
jgi:hypothetical protein